MVRTVEPGAEGGRIERFSEGRTPVDSGYLLCYNLPAFAGSVYEYHVKYCDGEGENRRP